MNLRIPGPTPCPPEVLAASARQMINHRGPEFATLIHGVTDSLKKVFQTQEDLLILTGSGTGAMEAAVVNTLSPGDKVLSVSNGVFGERFASIAQAYGADVERLLSPWGTPSEPQAIEKALAANPSIRAVLITHNETSTGVTNDLQAIAGVVKRFEKLLIVDAISSIGSIDLPVDKWNCDVVVSGSQKGWMVPPGLAFVSVSQEAWQAHKQAKMPRFYWDFGRAKDLLEKGQTPWTPAVSVLFALDTALEIMLKEGLASIFARHARTAKKARDGVKSMGLALYAKESHASNTVTAVNVPEGIDGRKLLQILREEHNLVLAGGQRDLQGKIFRIGHLGYVSEADIEAALGALREALPKMGFKGSGIGAGQAN